MQTTSVGPSPVWSEPTYDGGSATSGALSPELLLLALTAETNSTQTSTAKQSVEDAHARLQELRDEIAEAMERAREAQDDAGLWGDISSFLGDDVATIAGAIAAAALVVGTGGAGLAGVLALAAVGFTVGAKVGEELGLDPNVVMAMQLLGAAAGALAGNGASVGQLWGTVHTGAAIVQSGGVAAGGAAHIVEGQYEGAATEHRGEATYLRKSEQLELDLTDEQIAQIRELVEQLEFATASASQISSGRSELNESVIRRIGG